MLSVFGVSTEVYTRHVFPAPCLRTAQCHDGSWSAIPSACQARSVVNAPTTDNAVRMMLSRPNSIQQSPSDTLVRSGSWRKDLRPGSQ